MIFLAVVDLPRAVPDTCEACSAPARALLFTLSRRHIVDRVGRELEFYEGGPDVFLVCREHAAAARALMDGDVEANAHARRLGSVQASWGKLQRP